MTAGAEVSTNIHHATLKTKKEAADLEKKLIDTKKAQLEYQILKGTHVPTDMVRDTITELGKSMLVGYKEFADQFLTEIAHKFNFTPDDTAELKGKLTAGINSAHHKSIESAKKQITAIVAAVKKHNIPTDQQQQSDGIASA